MENDSGIQTICYVWSFNEKSDNDIPYRIDLVRYRNTNKKICSCPAYTYKGGRTCKHIQTLNSSIKDKLILSDKRYQLTDFGRVYFKFNE